MSARIGKSILLLLTVLLAGCAATVPAPPSTPQLPASPVALSPMPSPTDNASNESAPPPSYALDAVTITLERTPCFGACPEYSVTLHGDGTVNYAGQRFVKVLGTRQKQIPSHAVFELLRKFYEVDFFAMRPEYIEGRDIVLEPSGTVNESRVMVTDLPTTIITLTLGAYTKRVKAYYGAPEGLYTLATAIDETAGTGEWIK